MSALGAPSNAGAVLEIDLGAVRANYRLLRRRLGTRGCAAVVKADAYGLGAATVALALAAEGCGTFFVAHFDEAVALRPVLPATAAIYVLNGLSGGAEAECAARGITPVLNSLGQIDAWSALARRLDRALPAAVQVDSGMARLGLDEAEVAALAQAPARLAAIDVRLVMSHLACAERQDHPMNRAQLARFEAARRCLPAAPASLANSSGIFLGPDFHFDLARPGAALYGLAPVAGAANPLAPTVRLRAKSFRPAPSRPASRSAMVRPGPPTHRGASRLSPSAMPMAICARWAIGQSPTSAAPRFRSSGSCRWTPQHST